MGTDSSGKPKWLVIGAGSFGTAMTRVLGPRPVDLTLAARAPEHADAMRHTGTNERYFPGIEFPHDTHFTTVDEAAEREWDGIVLAVPSSAFAATVERFATKAPQFLSLGKGLDPSGRRLSEVASEFVDPDRFVTLSGPNIAREMMLDLPTAAVVAGTNVETVLAVQEIVSGFSFRVYASTDVIGVELAGASKNVIAIAAGVLEGSGFGDNAIAAMMTRGLGEMARLGLANGAELQTYLGLAGVGDLMVTCRSPHSRNHRAGRLFAEGLKPAEIRASIGQVVEGMRTAPIVVDMAREAGIDMHICDAVSQVVEHDVPLPDVVRSMLSRQPGFEFTGEGAFGLT
jgi:glycerol-3-phosphate dehydrogenase (NAD(P)+)